MTCRNQIATETTLHTLHTAQNASDKTYVPSTLPHDMPRLEGCAPSYAVFQHPLSPSVLQAISRLCTSNNSNPLAVFATSVGVLLGRYTLSEHVTLGIPSLATATNESARYLPLSFDLEPTAQVAPTIAQAQSKIVQLNEKATIADRHLQEVAEHKANALFRVRVETADDKASSIGDQRAAAKDAVYDLTLQLGHDQIQITFAQDIYHPQTIRQMATRLTTVLDQISDRPSAALKSLSLVGKTERSALAALYNVPHQTSAFDTIPQMISAMAKEQPNAVAVRDHESQLSYQDVDERSDQIAAFLSARGVTQGSKVGVYLRRHPDVVTWLLGILKLGAIYVPIDTRYPEDRVKTLLEDAPCSFCLVDPDNTYFLPKTCKGIKLDAFDPQSAPKTMHTPIAAQTQDTAYLIYTSGSTGKPKGIRISHANVVNLLEWTRETFSREDLGLVAATTSLNFDMSVFEIFGTLAAGGTLLMLDDALGIIDSPLQSAITLIDTVPSAIAAVLPLAPDLDSCRVINLGGEALPRALCDQIHAALPGVRLYNMYGPSETTTFSTFASVSATTSGTPNIGKPLRNTQLLIRNESGSLTPIGMIGELFIGGSGVTQGYLNRPELTASKYVCCAEYGATGQFFRTGDLVSWGPDGELRYHGRKDHQIKIRGHRVELGEVDAVLNTGPGVKKAVTIGTSLPGRDATVLVAYVTGSTDIDGLKAHVAARLPSYMVPAHIVPLAALPLNANGKLDRAQLPDPVAPLRSMVSAERASQADQAAFAAIHYAHDHQTASEQSAKEA